MLFSNENILARISGRIGFANIIWELYNPYSFRLEKKRVASGLNDITKTVPLVENPSFFLLSLFPKNVGLQDNKPLSLKGE